MKPTREAFCLCSKRGHCPVHDAEGADPWNICDECCQEHPRDNGELLAHLLSCKPTAVQVFRDGWRIISAEKDGEMLLCDKHRFGPGELFPPGLMQVIGAVVAHDMVSMLDGVKPEDLPPMEQVLGSDPFSAFPIATVRWNCVPEAERQVVIEGLEFSLKGARALHIASSTERLEAALELLRSASETAHFHDLDGRDERVFQERWERIEAACQRRQGMRWDEQRRCTFITDNGQCERRDDHKEDHATGLRDGHGNPWEHDRCFHFAGGDGTRCVYLYGHVGDHDPMQGQNDED